MSNTARDTLMAQLAELPREARRAIVAQVNKSEPEGLLSIARSRTGNVFPLPPGQRQLWILQRLNPESGAYNSCLALRLKGEVNISFLEAALHELEERHEVLRTTFPLTDQGPVQFIHPPQKGRLECVDLTLMPRELAEQWTSEFLKDDSCRPFDLEQLPLFRKMLFIMGEKEHIFWSTMHHMLADEWAAGIMMNEVAQSYLRMKTGVGQRPELPGIQYADFSVRQSVRLQNGEFDSQLRYWEASLAGVPKLDLPADLEPPIHRSDRGDVFSMEFHPGTVAWIRQTGASMFTALLAAFQLFLSDWTGQQDIAVGTPVANRSHITENMLGSLVNTIVLRTQIDSGQSFGAFLTQVQNNVLEAYSNQEVPFELVVDRLSPSRSSNSSPLFNVIFQVVGAPIVNWLGMPATAVLVPRLTSKLDLTLFVREVRGTLIGDWNYATDLFSKHSIEKAARRFAALLEFIARAPDASLADILKSLRAAPGAILS